MVTGTSSSAVLIAAAGGTVVLAPGDEGDALSSASHAQRRVSTNERAILEKSRSTWGGGAKRLLSQAAQKGGRKGRALSAPKMIVGMRKRRFCSWASPRLVMASRLVMYALLFALLPSPIICESEDYYCGMDWVHAANACPKPCPTGTDVECTDQLGDEYACFYYTGCYERYQSGEFGPLETDEPEVIEEGEELVEQETVIEATLSPNTNQYCASTWIQAMINCGGLDEEKACPNGDHDCDENEMCQTDTNCDHYLVELESEVQFTLIGPENTLERVEEQAIFLNVTGEYLRRTLESLKISFTSMEILEQEMVAGEVKVNVMIKAVHRPAMGTFTQKLDSIAENTINLQGQDVVKELKRTGNSEQEYYFAKIWDISVLGAAQLTERPTEIPAVAPTVKPEPTVTDKPSGMPTESLPSVIVTGSREDLQLGGMTTSSYGYVFNMRTKPDANVVLLTGMDFYTEATSDINFELWTYAGNYQDKKGAMDGSWTKIGGGVTRGRGIGRYTAIPEGMFKPVSIDGGGATRAFYLTLDSINLVYKLGQDAGIRGAPPDTYVHHESQDIEIWEGEGVLNYNRTKAEVGLPPFPDTSITVFYRYPRSFLGAVYYDSVPCQSLPCPLIPTGMPTVPPPTKSPATAEPSLQPTTEAPMTAAPTPSVTSAPISPTESPTVEPSSTSSRPFLTSLTTVTQRELASTTTSTSYGYIFNVRTKAEVGAVLIKGMDFYTDKFGSVNYELWTRPGTFIGNRGRYSGWELIATGSINGKGVGELTSIPEEDFTEVSINGGGSDQGTRAFYITLNSKDLVYQAPDQGGSLASKADVNVHDETDEIEIYDGEAILAYPFPPQSQSYMYRAPRKFLGTIYYDRLPCRPLSAFGIIRELPCPEGVAPTASPTIFSPTIFATNVPSIGGAVDEKPAIRANPTPAPSTLRGSISSDYFCGKSWVDAMTHCRVPCPSGENSECADIDPDYECQGFTGCSQAKLLLTDPPSGSPSKRPTSNPTTLKPTNPLTDSPTGRPTTASPTPSRTTFEDAAEDPSETESVDYSEGSIVSPTKKPIDGLADVAAASDEEGDAASDEENPPAAVEDADATGDVGLDAGEASVGTAGRSTTTQATAISVAGGGASDESSGTESTQIAAPSPSDGEGEAPAEEENADQVDPSTVESSEDAAGGETETIDFVEDFAEDEPLVEPLAGSACSCTQLFGRGVMAFSIALLI